jgi:hypothetical protein
VGELKGERGDFDPEEELGCGFIQRASCARSTRAKGYEVALSEGEFTGA